MYTFLILPHQLYEKKYLMKNNKYILWEHPHYFVKYKYNKKGGWFYIEELDELKAIFDKQEKKYEK